MSGIARPAALLTGFLLCVGGAGAASAQEDCRRTPVRVLHAATCGCDVCQPHRAQLPVAHPISCVCGDCRPTQVRVVHRRDCACDVCRPAPTRVMVHRRGCACEVCVPPRRVIVVRRPVEAEPAPCAPEPDHCETAPRCEPARAPLTPYLLQAALRQLAAQAACPEQQLAYVAALARSWTFDAGQVALLAQQLAGSRERLEALVLLYPSVSDPCEFVARTAWLLHRRHRWELAARLTITR